jgi:SAM-dependent methyltransferase
MGIRERLRAAWRPETSPRSVVADASALPPADLIWRVAGTPDEQWFLDSGKQTVVDWTAALESVGADLGSARRILDFGCGCGRVERWLQELGQHSELHAVDIDADAIAWAADHLPWARFQVGPTWPPLPYPDGYFDLVVNHSVFSHLDARYQDAWLQELRRVTSPGAYLLLSFHGDHAFDTMCQAMEAAGASAEPHRRSLAASGILFFEEDLWTGGPFPDFYHSTFHAPEYVRWHWGQFFEVRSLLERRALDYQDIVVLRHPMSGD